MNLWPVSSVALGAAVIVLIACTAEGKPAEADKPVDWLSRSADGRLVYGADAMGNRIPDFSYCGYAGGELAIPDAAVRVVVPPAEGDATQRIQAALDYVAGLPVDEFGLRGAVLLGKGRHEVSGQLLIRASGVVLRGSGMGEDGTVLVATGLDRRTLIRIVGEADGTEGEARAITDNYVPVGARRLTLDSTAGLVVGNTVLVRRACTQEWIDAVGTGDNPWRDYRIKWRPGTREVVWDRVIAAIDGKTITVDAPLTTAIEARYGGGTVAAYTWPGRVRQVGVENLRCVSTYDTARPKDEDHAWMGVTMENVADAWVRGVTFEHFAGSAVSIWAGCKRITVQDCIAIEPVSEIGGYRRHTFFTMGTQTLFLRCYSSQGRHDFSTGHCAPGPNAFVHCEAREALESSGPIEDWASGVLYDNVVIDGDALELTHRQLHGGRHAWSAANCVLWNCHAARIEFLVPPGACGWAFGSWSQCHGDAYWEATNDFVEPTSLYQAQLTERLGQAAGARVGEGPTYPAAGTSPTYAQAARAVADSDRPAESIADLAREALTTAPIPTDPGQAPTIDALLEARPELRPKAPAPPPPKPLALVHGWLVCDGKLLTGRRTQTMWWRGDIIPSAAAEARTTITRFVPGRVGVGYVEDLDTATDRMLAAKQVAMDYHYGLWYDRRRDDHERIRRMDGNVWPPFYELPFARSGEGTAWDGLSKYDLTKPNPWYWRRLERFADLADRKGLVLFYQHYFQHNILEAGAHWADFPWRSANNVNDTGFPEPPPYANNKRIFQAHLFYDVDHPLRRPLHQGYIRQCLDAFAGNTNVIHFTSAEYTGPVEFVQFWLDTIAAWQQETGHDVLVALSATKDVQDAILSDAARAKLVDVIDIRYWHYQADGSPYAPKGGRNLSPRQHARVLHPNPSSFAQVVRAVREYRERFPDKAVIYSTEGQQYGWAVLMGGGSLPDLGKLELDARLLAAIPRMAPAEPPGDVQDAWCLAEPGANYLVYTAAGERVRLDLSAAEGRLVAHWIDPASGAMTDAKPVSGGKTVTLTPPKGLAPAVVWVTQAP